MTSGPNVVVKSCATGCCLTNSDLSACIDSTYVYLDDAERSKFATNSFEVLVTQLQSYQIQTCNSQVRMQLNFNHPVKANLAGNRRMWGCETPVSVAAAA